MIQKVSSQNSVNLLNEQPFKRETVSKSATNPFASVLAKKAKDMKASGIEMEKIASTFNMSVENLNLLLKGELFVQDNSSKKENLSKIACSCELDESDSAQDAYDSIYGMRKQASSQSNTDPARKRILSANGLTSDITNIGGPRKQIGSQSSNSIFDPHVIEKASTTPDNGEKIRAERESILKHREEIKQSSRNQNIDIDSLGKMLKSNSVSPVDNTQASKEAHSFNKRVPSNGMSIFDDTDKGFDRIGKTAGEKMVERKIAESKPKNRDWAKAKPSTKSSSIFKNMIDSFMDGKENQ